MKVSRTSLCWKLRSRRFILTLMVTFILVAALSMVYLGYEVFRIPLQKDEYVQKEKLSVLEGRLQKMEKELRKNRQYYNRLVSSVKPDVKHHTVVPVTGFYFQQRNRETTGANLSHVNDLVLTCPDAVATSMVAASDFSMPNIYSEISFDNIDGGVWKQGWPITYDKDQWNQANKLRVIVVPHSHNDPGWIKTFENYYLDQTRYILNNMVTKLKENPKMKMIWSEISYLALWWERASSTERKDLKRIINNGQLEIVTGGWVMSDEAVAHYFAIIEQMIEGHEWMENHLGYFPENGWAIDPFGLSPTMAYLLKRSGLSHMVIQRVHYSIKKYLAQLRGLEFRWRQEWDQANVTDIFCHLMPFYSYDVPHTCGPDPKICCQFDFKRLPGGKISCPWKIVPQPITPANVEERASLLLDQYRKKAQLFRSNVVLIPLGDDFRYDKQLEWDQQYLNYQALFNFMNSKSEWNVKAQFGTLRDYFTAVEEEISAQASKGNRIEIPSFSGDFFTYADRDDHYWSGYYSSRPLYKSMDRVLESYVRAAEILFSSALAHLSQLKLEQKFFVDELLQQIVTARRNLALFQHHDAITGTAKDPVVIDYGKRMLQAINCAQTVIGKSAALLLSPPGKELESSIIFDLDDNRASHSSISKKTLIDVTTEGKTVAFYNSLAHRREQIVNLLVSSADVCIFNSNDSVVLAQMNPVWHGNDVADDKFELNFVVDTPPLGLSVYTLKLSPNDVKHCLKRSTTTLYNVPSLPASRQWQFQLKNGAEFTVTSSQLEATFSSDGLLKSVKSLYDNHTEPASVSFLTYGTTLKKDKSGAYLFLPDGEAMPMEYDTPPYFRLQEGFLVTEVRTFLTNVEHSVQLRHTGGVDGMALHIFNLVDITRELNKELVMRINTNISNMKTFFTDLNGFQMTRRTTIETLPIQGNYYPISSAIYIEDRASRFTVLTGQPLGGSSLLSGSVEIILDRRLNQDDNRGLQQGVLDNKITPSSFTFLFEKRGTAGREPQTVTHSQMLSLTAHFLSHFLLYPILRLIDTSEDPSNVVAKSKLLPTYSLIENDLPCDMHFVNLRVSTMESALEQSMVLSAKNHSILTIHHFGFDCSIYRPPIDCSFSDGKVNLERLFGKYFRSDMVEVTLSGLYDFEKFAKAKTLFIPAMEINAYRLYR